MAKHFAVDATRQWVERFIVRHNICPFARRELDNDSIRYLCSEQRDTQENLTILADELIYLDANPDTVTTLVIFTRCLQRFDDYLDFLDWSQQLLSKLHYEGVYQLASFHPDYCFEGSSTDDASNFTNRSPFPMLHIIREESIEKALQHYQNPQQIPARNIALTRQMGIDVLSNILNECMNPPPSSQR